MQLPQIHNCFHYHRYKNLPESIPIYENISALSYLINIRSYVSIPVYDTFSYLTLALLQGSLFRYLPILSTLWKKIDYRIVCQEQQLNPKSISPSFANRGKIANIKYYFYDNT